MSSSADYPGAQVILAHERNMGDRFRRPPSVLVVDGTGGLLSAVLSWWAVPPGEGPGKRGRRSSDGKLYGPSSVHFVVGMDGRVVQCVPLDRAAYHVGGNTAWQGRDGVDFFSIGVRLETDGPGRWGWTDEQWIAGVKLCRWLVRRYGIEKPDVVTVKMVLNGGGREVDVFPLAGLLRELYPAEQQALLEGGLEGE